MTYKNLTDNNQLQFESQKLLQMLPDTNVTENEKMSALGVALTKITEITVKALGQSIAVIKTPSALVNENEFIEDFLKNCDKNLFNQIRTKILELKEKSEMQPLTMTCPECSNVYTQPMTLDMSSFFESAS